MQGWESVQVPTSQSRETLLWQIVFSKDDSVAPLPHAFLQCDLAILTSRDRVGFPSPLISEGLWLLLPIECSRDAVLTLRLGWKGSVPSRHPCHLPPPLPHFTLVATLALWSISWQRRIKPGLVRGWIKHKWTGAALTAHPGAAVKQWRGRILAVDRAVIYLSFSFEQRETA